MIGSNDKPHILIVDDEPEIRDVLLSLLAEQYECSSAASAESALQALQERPFHLILSDISMSGMSGLEMLALVQRVAPETISVMISGSLSIENAVEALRLGAFDYITKPFILIQVEQAVKRAVEHYELRAAKRRYEARLEELVNQRTCELERALTSLENSYRSTLKALTAALEARDHETSGHSERVVTFSLRLGRELGLSQEHMRALEFGSLLHDIGKIGVPDAILCKPSHLTEDEWALMRQHPLHGQQILAGIEFLEGPARVVAQHHERWDGTGYPLGLKAEEIDLNTRIFQVADTFDAITSDRIYSQARSYEEAVRELEDWSGRQFDPQVVEAFRRIPPEEWAELRRTAEHISFAESAALSAQHDSYLELSRPANSEFLFSRSYKSLAAAL